MPIERFQFTGSEGQQLAASLDGAHSGEIPGTASGDVLPPADRAPPSPSLPSFSLRRRLAGCSENSVVPGAAVLAAARLPLADVCVVEKYPANALRPTAARVVDSTLRASARKAPLK